MLEFVRNAPTVAIMVVIVVVLAVAVVFVRR